MLNLFEIELFICIKMDLALNDLQGLICHKTQTNKMYLLSKHPMALQYTQSISEKSFSIFVPLSYTACS